MKREMALGLATLLATSSAFASGSQYMRCTVDGKDIEINMDFVYDEGGVDPDHPATGAEAKIPSYIHLTDDVSITNEKGDKDLATIAQPKNPFGYFTFENRGGEYLDPVLKVDFKNDDGSVLVIRASGKKSKPNNPHGNFFQELKGTATMVLKGKDAAGAKGTVPVLRNAAVTCQGDTD